MILNDFTLGNKYLTNHDTSSICLYRIYFFVLVRPIVLQLDAFGVNTYVYMPDRWSNTAASHVKDRTNECTPATDLPWLLSVPTSSSSSRSQ